MDKKGIAVIFCLIGLLFSFLVVSSEWGCDGDIVSMSLDEIDNIAAVCIVDLSVNETVSKTSARIGDEITYVITVHNYGLHNASNVNVTERIS